MYKEIYKEKNPCNLKWKTFNDMIRLLILIVMKRKIQISGLVGKENLFNFCYSKSLSNINSDPLPAIQKTWPNHCTSKGLSFSSQQVPSTSKERKDEKKIIKILKCSVSSKMKKNCLWIGQNMQKKKEKKKRILFSRQLSIFKIFFFPQNSGWDKSFFK